MPEIHEVTGSLVWEDEHPAVVQRSSYSVPPVDDLVLQQRLAQISIDHGYAPVPVRVTIEVLGDA